MFTTSQNNKIITSSPSPATSTSRPGFARPGRRRTPIRRTNLDSSDMLTPELTFSSTFYSQSTSMGSVSKGEQLFKTFSSHQQSEIEDDESRSPSPAFIPIKKSGSSQDDLSSSDASTQSEQLTEKKQSNFTSYNLTTPIGDDLIALNDSLAQPRSPTSGNDEQFEEGSMFVEMPVMDDLNDMLYAELGYENTTIAGAREESMMAQSLPDLIACLPLNVQKHRSFLNARLTHILTNSHQFFTAENKAGLAASHLHILAELLRFAYLRNDEFLVGSSTKLIKFLYQLKPTLCLGSPSSSSSSHIAEQSLVGHMVKVSLAHTAHCEALQCLELMLANFQPQQQRGYLDFITGIICSMATSPNFTMAYDTFAAVLASLTRMFDRILVSTAAASEQWEAFSVSFAALALKVAPSSRGRSTGYGNGCFLPSLIPTLRDVCEALKPCRRAMFALFGTLVKLHPQHGQQMLQAGVVRLATDFVLHGCILAKKGVSEGEQLQIGSFLEFLAAIVEDTPHGAGSTSAGSIVVSTVTHSHVAQLSALFSPRHTGNPGYSSLIRYCCASLPASPSALEWLQTAQEMIQEEILSGLRIDSNCQALAALWTFCPGYYRKGSSGTNFRDVLSSVCRIVHEGLDDVLPRLHEVLVSGEAADEKKGDSALRAESFRALWASLPTAAREKLISSSVENPEVSTTPPPSSGVRIVPDSSKSTPSTITNAFAGSLVVQCSSWLHPVRFFAWPTTTTVQLHRQLLSVLMLSRLHPKGLHALTEASTNGSASERVGMGELGCMLQCLLTGSTGRIAAPSAPSSTTFTYLVAPHGHTSYMMKESPAMLTTVILLLADVMSLSPMPMPLSDPLPTVRVVIARLEQLRLPVPTQTSELMGFAYLQFLSAAARASSFLQSVQGNGSISPTHARATPLAISKTIEACNDVFTRGHKPALLSRMFSLFRAPGLLEAVCHTVQANDACAAILLRWVLYGLRHRDTNVSESAPSSYSLAMDTCAFLQMFAADGSVQPRGRAVYRYLFSRPEVEEALLDVARRVQGLPLQLCCVMNGLWVAVDLFNPFPYLGYDCPNLFMTTDRAFPSGPSGTRFRAARVLLGEKGMPALCGDVLDCIRSSASPKTLMMLPELFRLAAVYVELRSALERERGCVNGALSDLVWVKQDVFPAAMSLLVVALSSPTCCSRFAAESEELAGRESAWDSLGASICELVGALLTTDLRWTCSQFSLSDAPPALDEMIAKVLASPPGLAAKVRLDLLLTPARSDLQRVLDCLLDVLPEPRSIRKRLQGHLSSVVAALALQGCDIASEGRGTAILSMLESAISVPESLGDLQLHNSTAKIICALSRSSDALRDIIVAGPVLRYLTMVLQHSRGPVALPRYVTLRREDARVLVDTDVLHDGCTVVLVCQAAAALANTPSRAQRLHCAAIPTSILWLMSKHPTYRDSIKMQKVGLAAILAAWCCKTVRQSMLLKERQEESVSRAADILQAAVERGGYGHVERSFCQGMVDQLKSQMTEADCMMS